MTLSTPSPNQIKSNAVVDPFDEFVYIVSHDLKEPLRGILTYISFIMEDHPDLIEGKLEERLTKISGLSTKMNRMLEALTQYSRIGRINESTSAVDMNRVVQGIAGQIQSRYAQTPPQIVINRPLPRLNAQPKHVDLLFSHLLENGIKFNDLPMGERHLEIDVTKNGQEAILSIQDNGIGIPTRYQERVFKIFKSKLHRDRYGDGIGHGLAIVSKVLELYAGKIWVTSNEGAGSTFYVSLPIELTLPSAEGV